MEHSISATITGALTAAGDMSQDHALTLEAYGIVTVRGYLTIDSETVTGGAITKI